MLNKEQKRGAALICAAAVCMGVTSCGGKKGDENTTLTMLIPGDAQTDIASVMEKANEITKEKIGAGLDLQFIDNGAYNEKMNMKMASRDDTYDVAFVGYLSTYDNAIKNEALAPLTELIEKNAPELKDAVSDYMWQDAVADGEIYAVPNEQVVFNQYAYFVQKDLADKYGWTKTKIDSPEELEPLMEQIKNGENGIYPYRTNYGVAMWLLNNYEEIGGGIVIPTDGDYKNAQWQVETPEYKEGVKKLREWYQKGYIREDVASVTDDSTDLAANRYAIYSARWKPGAEAQVMNSYGKEYMAVLVGDSYMKNRASQDTMLGVNVNSKNKEKAIKLISLLNTDKDFYNLICFGIEGKHYEKNADGKIKLIQNSGYAPNAAWKFGNQFNALLLENESDDVWEETKRLNEECKKSPVQGMYFNSDPVSAQIAQVTALNDEYKALTNGSRDYNTIWDEMIKRYEEAGIKDILTEVSKQLEEFMNK